MLFTSLQFPIFFLIVTAIYFLLPHKHRWVLLLAASYYFYMCWKIEYIFLIVASTLIDYYCGLQMEIRSEKSKRKKFLYLSLFVNLGILFAFKYFNFFNDSLRELFNSLNRMYEVPFFDVLLPVGISFYTFQTLSYSIDVYRGEKKAEKHLGYFALYVTYFPQLVAGPIERSTRLLPQLFKEQSFISSRVFQGLRIMLMGFFKKLVIADYLAVYVDRVFSYPEHFTGFPVYLASVFFVFQVYCDFSGYSDIAIGAAKIMGIDLMENFRRPFFAKSIRELWRRWHISLITWFKDYVYVPMGSRSSSTSRWLFNLIIVFVISGLWHGANWTFIAWGFLHGLFVCIDILSKKIRIQFYKVTFLDRLPAFLDLLKIIITFNVFAISAIYFRADSISDAHILLNNLFNTTTRIPIIPTFSINIAFISITTLMTIEYLHEFKAKWLKGFQMPSLLKYGFYSILIILILIYTGYNPEQFIYFQF